MIGIVFALAVSALAPNSLTAGDAAAAPLSAYPGLVEDCIQENAPKIELAFQDLNQGADYLVLKVCAVPIAEETARRQRAIQEASAARAQQLCDQQNAATAGDKPANGASAPSPNYCALAKLLSQTLSAQPFRFDPWSPIAPAGTAPPAAIAMAAKLLLDLRAAHVHRHAGEHGE